MAIRIFKCYMVSTVAFSAGMCIMWYMTVQSTMRWTHQHDVPRTTLSDFKDTKTNVGEIQLLEGNSSNANLRVNSIATTKVQTNASYWDWVDGLLSPQGMYRKTDDIAHIIEAMRTSEVTSVSRFLAHTSLKFMVILSGGQKCIFKPYLEKRGPNERYEDPHYEIAYFHIDRLLGMRKVPYATGRVLDIRTEILPVADASLTDFFSLHANGTVCFTFKCHTCVESRHFCYANGGMPGALIYFVRRKIKRQWGHSPTHPLHPSGNITRIVYTFTVNNDTLCRAAQSLLPHPSIYMDLHDMNILDYLMVNSGTEYFHVIHPDGQHYVTLHIDHGDRLIHMTPDTETRYLLSALRQCCRIRLSTYRHLLNIYKLGDEHLQQTFYNWTRNDPLYPILTREEIVGILGRVLEMVDVADICHTLVGQDLYVYT